MAQRVDEAKYEAMISALNTFASNVYTASSEMQSLASVCTQALGEEDKAVGVDRKSGFIDAFKQNNENSTVNFVCTDFSFMHGYEKAEEALKYEPTAIICATDNICLHNLQAYNVQHGDNC